MLRRRAGATINTIDVSSVDAVGAHGAKTAVPQMATPGVGYLAYRSGSDENTFGIAP